MTSDHGATPKRLSLEEVQAIFDRSPVMSFMGLEVLAVDHEREEIVIRMPMRPEFERKAGTQQFHGGPIASFIDITGDFAIGMMVGGGVPTVHGGEKVVHGSGGVVLPRGAPKGSQWLA
jgi:acyl-coenzyme A thioesterase PaaI-like protein